MKGRSQWVPLLIVAASVGACGGREFSDGFGGGGTADGGAASSSTGASGSVGVGASVGVGGFTGTGGSPGVGGSTGMGGTSGTGGSTGTGGTGGGPPECAMQTVSFKMVAGGTPTAGDYCVGLSCGLTWLSIKTQAGQPVDFGGGCITTCGDCKPVVCAGTGACAAPHRMNPNGEQQTWNGQYWTRSTCGAGIACSNAQCATPGSHFVATMCAYPSTNPDSGSFICTSTNTPTCVDVPFDYPTPGVIEGVLNR